MPHVPYLGAGIAALPQLLIPFALYGMGYKPFYYLLPISESDSLTTLLFLM